MHNTSHGQVHTSALPSHAPREIGILKIKKKTLIETTNRLKSIRTGKHATTTEVRHVKNPLIILISHHIPTVVALEPGRLKPPRPEATAEQSQHCGMTLTQLLSLSVLIKNLRDTKSDIRMMFHPIQENIKTSLTPAQIRIQNPKIWRKSCDLPYQTIDGTAITIVLGTGEKQLCIRSQTINGFPRTVIVNDHSVSNPGRKLPQTRLQPINFVARRMKRNEQQQEFARARYACLIETSQAKPRFSQHRRTPSQPERRLPCSHRAGAPHSVNINDHSPSTLF